MDTTVTFLTLSIIFLSAFVRSALGFGDALIAMPLLVLLVGAATATPVVAFNASTIAALILLRAWPGVDVKAAWRLVLSTLVGIPIGLVFLRAAPEWAVNGVLGLVLIGFGVYNLLALRLPYLESERFAPLFGLAAGVLGGAYNTNGPPVIIYSVLRRWDPQRFRATLQGYFLPTGGMILLSHGLAGLWTAQAVRLYLYGLPFVVAGVVIGGVVHRRVSGERFKQAVYAFLVVTGAALVIGSF
ncbi:MAG: sulfite exporter TauE/SafE family protein [Anaerolineae bacterium]|nr:sulfite exporter TauE/SafE family protein [Anaerolineae bacterium]